ncbi:MAG: hypothetical protein R3B54_02170 [Bdellovibrionota bacterium]
MLRSKTLPSDHFPAYFSLETGVDTEHAAPVVHALNQIGERFLIHAHRIAASAIPSFFEASQQVAVLGGLGFETQHLSLDEKEGFYDQMSAILQNRGRLSSVRLWENSTLER